jgi:hypothetical protein
MRRRITTTAGTVRAENLVRRSDQRRPAGLPLQAGQRRRTALVTHPAAKNNRVVPGLAQTQK